MSIVLAATDIPFAGGHRLSVSSGLIGGRDLTEAGTMLLCLARVRTEYSRLVKDVARGYQCSVAVAERRIRKMERLLKLTDE
jgi:hypothetical protein